MTMANARRLSSVLFFVVIVIIASAEYVRSHRHHYKSSRRGHNLVTSLPHQRPSHLRRPKQLHHRQSEHLSHHGESGKEREKTYTRRSRHVYGNPFLDNLLRHAFHHTSKGGNLFYDHYRSPVFTSFHKHYRDQLNLMEKLRSHMVSRVGQLRGRMATQQHGFHHPSQKHKNSRDHINGHHYRSYQSRPPTRRNGHHGGRQNQYKVIRNNYAPVQDIPEDVEVFGRPTVVRSRGRPSFTPNVWVTSFSGVNPKNCTKKQRNPFRHTEIKSTSISHSRNNFSPVHSVISSHSVLSGGKYHRGEKGNHPLGDVLGSSFPGYSNIFSRPATRIHDSNIKNHEGTVRISIGPRGRSQKPSVEEHLNKLPSVKSDKTDEIPCIKCPPDTRVEAPRGSDCVIAHPPSPLSCTPRFLPELRTVVTEGPAPGSLLPEGRYKMIITVWSSDSSTSTPITTCDVNYDVAVRKCPVLPEVEGGEVTCTAGRAWGSKCSWVCKEGQTLTGSSTTTCTGHSRPHWTHPTPLCKKLPFEKPELPSVPSPPLRPARPPSNPKGNCPQPPDIPGGRLICEPPSVEIIPLWELVPKDEPAPPTTSDDSPPEGLVGPRRASTPKPFHPVGTSCRVECDPGLVLRQSEMDRVFVSCSPALVWNRGPSACYPKDPPMPRDNDCDDLTVAQDQVSSLPLPVFFSANGDQAEVTCNIHEMNRGQYFIRKCKAIDQDLQTSATCQYIITVRAIVEFPNVRPYGGATEGSEKNPKNTEYETVADVFRSKGKKHKTNKSPKPDKISFIPKYQGTGFHYFHNTFNQEGHDDRPYKTIAESALLQTGKISRAAPKIERFDDGVLITGTSSADSQTSATPLEGESERSFSSPKNLVPKPESTSGLNEEETFRTSREQETISNNLASGGDAVHINNKTREISSAAEQLRDKVNKERGVITRGEEAKETETALMEATIKLKILVDDCRNSDQIKEALYGLLMMLEGCKKLACYNPNTKCRHKLGHEESVIKVSWVVGGPFEPLDDYYYDDLQVPAVETDIESLMISAERLITSERTTRVMEDFGAAIDLTSFNLDRLDLLCQNKDYSFDAQSNRCVPNDLQEL